MRQMCTWICGYDTSFNPNSQLFFLFFFLKLFFTYVKLHMWQDHDNLHKIKIVGKKI